MKRPDFSLTEAIGWYLSDMRTELAPGTLRRYEQSLRLFCQTHDPVLASLTPESVDRWSRQTSKTYHTRMNRIIAFKALATYLARQKLWYEGPPSAALSVLAALPTPQPLAKGTPGYSDSEVRTISRSIPAGPTSLRIAAILAVELHGFRAKEVRTMLRRNVILPERGEVMGHFIIDREGTKSDDGARVVPMEPLAKDAIQRYVRHERPDFRGTGSEPLFLTDKGLAISEDSWGSMVRRLRNAVGTDVPFRQHRLRSTRVRQLHSAGVPDSVIIELMGWSVESGPRMLRRYVGRIPLSTLKKTPVLLDQMLGRTG